jgi:integrase
MLSAIQFLPAAPEKSFVQYVADFWLPDSPYVREYALVKKKPLSAEYIIMNHENVRRHMVPFEGFQGVSLKTLTAGIVKDWMLWAAANGRGARSINVTLQAMRVPVRYALSREELDRDPFRNIKDVPEQRQENGILSSAEVSQIIAAPMKDPWSRLAVLLAVLCGLRRGEVRGLQWGDIENGIITVCHNYQDREGLKVPKWESKRQVPIPHVVQVVLDSARILSNYTAPEDFVMAGPLSSGKPYSTKYFQLVLSAELAGIGIHGEWKGKGTAPTDYVNEQRQRNLTYHSLRHTFITLGRLAGITDLEIQALAGHKSGAMMERYSHAGQVLDFTAAREKLEKAVGNFEE